MHNIATYGSCQKHLGKLWLSRMFPFLINARFILSWPRLCDLVACPSLYFKEQCLCPLRQHRAFCISMKFTWNFGIDGFYPYLGTCSLSIKVFSWFSIVLAFLLLLLLGIVLILGVMHQIIYVCLIDFLVGIFIFGPS